MQKINSGKVRDIYELENGNLLIVTSNRISAFDCVLPFEIPRKGAWLNLLSAFWFDTTKHIVPNHMISITDGIPEEFQTKQYADCCMVVKKLDMFPIECIVRGYITGSGWESYKKTGSVCGIPLKAGLSESAKLDTPIFTPTTKAKNGHDEPITFEETCSLIGKGNAKALRDLSIQLYMEASKVAYDKGIIIADTKLEFGRDENGEITLGDEAFTSDSSRFWSVEDYEIGKPQKSFDKQFLRDFLSNCGWNKEPPVPEVPADIIAQTADKYLCAYKLLTDPEFYESTN